jgi:cytochrome c-type biogenesis protein CcmH/NrfF
MATPSNEPVILSGVRRDSAERHEGSAVASPKACRSRQPGPTRWLQCAEALLLAVAVCFSLGAASPASRLNTLSHQLMCQCGCAQLLGECDHVGCPDRDTELSQLTTGIAAGLSDQQIFDAFVAKYGATVLAAPTTHGFDLVAWIAPFAVFGAALLLTILLIRRWGGLGGKPQAGFSEPAFVDPAERERIERIRRDTGSEGGY